MAEKITITENQDGSYTVQSTEDPGEPAQGDRPLNQTVQTVAEVLQLVRQELSDDQDDGQQAWASESAKRGPSGFPRTPGDGPSMSM
jgi:hypothetical protein